MKHRTRVLRSDRRFGFLQEFLIDYHWLGWYALAFHQLLLCSLIVPKHKPGID
jgi:hypothetical protein